MGDLGFEERNQASGMEFTDEELAQQISAYLNHETKGPKLWDNDDGKRKDSSDEEIIVGSTRSGRIRKPLPQKFTRRKTDEEIQRLEEMRLMKAREAERHRRDKLKSLMDETDKYLTSITNKISRNKNSKNNKE